MQPPLDASTASEFELAAAHISAGKNSIFYTQKAEFFAEACIEFFANDYLSPGIGRKPVVVLMGSMRKVQEFYANSRVKSSINVILVESSLNSLHSSKKAWQEACEPNATNRIVMLSIETFATLCWHGFVKWDADFAALFIADCNPLTSMHVVNKLVRHFLTPLKYAQDDAVSKINAEKVLLTKRSSSSLTSLSSIDRIPRLFGAFSAGPNPSTAANGSSMQTLLYRILTFHREYDCDFVDLTAERRLKSCFEVLREFSSFPALVTSSTVTYSSGEHKLLLVGRLLKRLKNFHTVVLVAADAAQAERLYGEVHDAGWGIDINVFCIRTLDAGRPPCYWNAARQLKNDFVFFKSWDDFERASVVIVEYALVNCLLVKNISISDIWVYSASAVGDTSRFLAQIDENVGGRLWQLRLVFFCHVKSSSKEIQSAMAAHQLSQLQQRSFVDASFEKIFAFHFGHWQQAQRIASLSSQSAEFVWRHPSTRSVLCPESAAEVLQKFTSALPRYSFIENRAISQITRKVSSQLPGNPCLFVTEMALPRIPSIPVAAYHDLLQRSANRFESQIKESKKESIMSCAFKLCRALIDASLLDEHLLPCAAIVESAHIAEMSLETKPKAIVELIAAEESSHDAVCDHRIPATFQPDPLWTWSDPCYLYIINTKPESKAHATEDKKISSLSDNTASLLNYNNGFDYFKFKRFLQHRFNIRNIAEGAVTWGILLQKRIALNVEPFPLTIDSSCHITEVFYDGKTKRLFKTCAEFESFLNFQAEVFKLLLPGQILGAFSQVSNFDLNSEPKPESLTAIPQSNAPLDRQFCYFLVPLIREKVKLALPCDFEHLFNIFLEFQNFNVENAASNVTSTSPSLMKSDWCVNWELIESFAQKFYFKDFVNFARSWYESSSYDDSLLEHFVIFCAKYFYLKRVFKNTFCKFAKFSETEFPLSPFEDFTCSPNIKTYCDYYKIKHGVEVKNLHNPLVMVVIDKIFPSYLQESDAYVPNLHLKAKKSTRRSRGRVEHQIFIPDEYLLITPIPVALTRLLYLVPSVVHHMANVSLCGEFYARLASHSRLPLNASSKQCLESLTFPVANQILNYERLEFLGDTLLKFGVTCFLFGHILDASEKVLSEERQRIISNSNLCKIALKFDFDWAAIVAGFNTKLWTPPHLRPFFNDERYTVCASSKFTANYLFNENIYWNLRKIYGNGASTLRDDHAEAELTADGKLRVNEWIPAALAVNRRPVQYSCKSMADLVEASIGLFYLADKTDASFENSFKWMMDIGILPCNPLTDSNFAAIVDTEIKAFEASAISDAYLADVQKSLGYTFKNIQLLKVAYTFSSLQMSQNYERMEFLGDAVLDMIVVDYFYKRYPFLTPSQMTECRTIVTNNLSFGCILVQNNLHIPVKSYSEDIALFERYLNENPDILFYEMSYNCPKFLGDLFESVAGALWIDCSFNIATFRAIFDPILRRYIDHNLDFSADKSMHTQNPVCKFLSACFKLGIKPGEVECRLEGQTAGEGEMPENQCAVYLRGKKIAEAKAHGKSLARKHAMKAALDYFVNQEGFKYFII